MGRTYAGILGPLAMAVAICRGFVESGGVEGTLSQATVHLILFSVVGAFIGYIAQSTVDESVRVKLEQQLADTTESGRAGASG